MRTLSGGGACFVGDSTSVEEDPVPQNRPEEAYPTSSCPATDGTRVTSPSSPSGHVSSDSEGKVEQLVLWDTEM